MFGMRGLYLQTTWRHAQCALRCFPPSGPCEGTPVATRASVRTSVCDVSAHSPRNTTWRSTRLCVGWWAELCRLSPDLEPAQFPKCPVCERAFPNQWAIRRHMKSHTDERQYRCHVCGRAFRLKHHLKNHCRNVHGMFESGTVDIDDADIPLSGVASVSTQGPQSILVHLLRTDLSDLDATGCPEDVKSDRETFLCW